MKMKTMYKFVACLMLLVAISCKETEEIQPTPAPPADGGKTPAQIFTFTVKPSILPTASVFTAVVSVVKEDGSVLYTDANLALTLKEGVLVSRELDLPAGKYTLTKLLVKDEGQNVILALPHTNSTKAAGISKALPFNFTGQPLTIETLNVNETDLPEEFGYPATEFGERPYIKIHATAVVNTGDVTYTPEATIHIAANGWAKEVLNGSEIRVPKKHSTYRFTATVWTKTATKDIPLQTLKHLPGVTLEVLMMPRLIRTEEVSTSTTTGGSVVTSKKEYSYNDYNNLKEILSYQKNKDTDELKLTTKQTFGFALNQLQTINTFDGDGNFIGYRIFWYDPVGRVTKIEEENYKMKTIATFNHQTEGRIEGNYLFHNGKKMSYTMYYTNGNKTADSASGNGSETGKYRYDDKVNPYYVLNCPDLYLSNSSKNNKISEEKSYGGNIPSIEVYATEYHYDAQGYPDMVIKKYRGFTSKQHLFTDTIEYSYY